MNKHHRLPSWLLSVALMLILAVNTLPVTQAAPPANHQAVIANSNSRAAASGLLDGVLGLTQRLAQMVRVQPVSQAAAPANGNAGQAAKLDPNKVVDGVACRDVTKFGIDKQMNIHASLIMAACGLTPATNSNKLPSTGGNMALPANYGGTDVDVILPDGTPPHITQSESFVWGHGSTIVVNYNDSRTAPSCYSGLSYSTDGGATFVVGQPLCSGHGTNFGDPTVVWDDAHSVWVATDLASGCGGQGVGAWRSVDGITWTAGGCAMNSSQGDRNSSWVDNNPSSPHYGIVYSSYNDLNVGGGALYVSRSTDGGLTWSAGVQLDPSFIRDVQLTGAADGTILEAAMNEGGGGLNSRSNVFYRSTDGGATFTQVYNGPPFYPAGRCVSSYFAGMYCNPTGYFRYMSWGQPAGGGPQIGGQNVFHYVYSMGSQGVDSGNVMYIRSTDNGVTWSAPLQLNTDTTNKAQFMPSLSETSSGALMASWYDERNNGRGTNDCAAPGTNSPCYEWYGRLSLDNGATWQADMPVSDAISPLPAQNDPNIQPLYVGDYNYASADGNTAYTTWTDGRTLIGGTSQQDVYFDKVNVTVGMPTPTATNTATRTPAPPTSTPLRTNTPAPTATECAMNFSDVPPAYWAYNYIKYLYCRGYVSGYADGNFRPNDNITRAQFSAIVERAFGFPLVTPGAQSFTDVPPTYWAYSYIETLFARGVVSGYADGTFRPNNNITRAEMAKTVVVASGTPLYYGPLPDYTDVPPTYWAYEYIKTAAYKGWVSGYADGTFRPGILSTRAQLCKVVYLALVNPESYPK